MPLILFNKHCEPDMVWCDEVVNIMRPNLLQNPQPITRDVLRVDAIRYFRGYLFLEMEKPESKVKREILRLARMHRSGKNIALLCCCSPSPCHGDVVKKAVEHYSSRMKDPIRWPTMRSIRGFDSDIEFAHDYILQCIF